MYIILNITMIIHIFIESKINHGFCASFRF